MTAPDMPIEEIVRIHDDDPAAAAHALRAMCASAMADKDLPQFSWLVNHVIGEKLGAWSEALQLQRLLPPTGPVVLRLQHAAAALLAGQAVQAWALQARIAQESGAPAEDARAAVALRVLQYTAESADPHDFAMALLDCARSLPAGPGGRKLGMAIASSLNNSVSALVERKVLPVDDAAVKSALVEGAQISRGVWGEAGTWMNHERADYLIALCGNRTGEWSIALQAARNGIATIEANGSEDVDRAFLLEVARASHGLGDESTRESARAEAVSMSQAFDASLHGWFNDCLKRA
ncbi:hypothetical protein GHT07_05395 [Caenimonas koreensis DSM 17982]|uniref:Uncharacterized protein n=1 Tax=Caenimonas koreensis DSM 17982 TaxID=1121255 RepID=A0A844AQW7_9BURK|nr:hypothetical protein [Caenimonas koreensis]MRD46700.1 hypothetical protein [Caenimonas koreensis DSM 17982]